MWRAGNTASPPRHAGLCYAAVCFALAALAWLAGPARAQIATPPADLSKLQAPLFDQSHARQGYFMAEAWAHAGRADLAKVTPLRVTGVAGVRVTLRLAGQTLGSGQAISTGPLQDAVDLSGLLGVASRQAIEQVDESMRDATKRALLLGREVEERVTAATIGPRLRVDVQYAHSFEPITLPADAGPNDLLVRFSPGLHGLRLWLGNDEAVQAWTWPATSLAMNLAPRSQVVGPLSDLGLQVTHLSRVGKPVHEGGIPVERFRVTHLVRPVEGSPVTELVRGQVVLPPAIMGEHTLDGSAVRMTEHLLRRLRSDGLFAGTFQPTSDRYDPPTAPAHDAALACYALARRAQWLLHHDPQDPRAAEIHRSVRLALSVLAKEMQAGRLDAGSLSLILLASVEGGSGAEFKPMRDDAARRLLALCEAEGNVRAAEPADAPRANAPTRALAGAALASAYRVTRNPELGKAARLLCDGLWRDAKPEELASLQPWLAKAEFALRQTMAPQDKAEDAAIARVATLAQLAKLIRDRQVRPGPDVPPDMVGGFDLHTRAADALPWPDWRTAQMLAFLAVTLADPDVPGSQEQRMTWLLDCGSAARFVAQLMIDEPGCYYVRNPRDALGGVRPAMWDNRLSLPPTAMGLLALTELQEAMRRF